MDIQMMIGNTMAKTSDKAAERVKELQGQMDEMRDAARAELIDEIEERIATLKDLGFDYRLTSGGTRKGTVTRSKDPNRPCPICKFVTDPAHDARTHRGQGSRKKAFTADELKELNLRKVS